MLLQAAVSLVVRWSAVGWLWQLRGTAGSSLDTLTRPDRSLPRSLPQCHNMAAC